MYPLGTIVLTSIVILILSILGTTVIAFFTMRLGGRLHFMSILIVGGSAGLFLIALFLFNFVIGK